MKRYLKELSIIVFIVFVGTYILSEKSFSDDFIIYKTIDTHYKKVAWNLNTINNRKELLDNSTIFLGSSIVQGGINDSLLNSAGIKATNMGVPHNGNELTLYFQNRILKSSNPKKIIYLKGKIPYSGLHKLTPLLYTSSELLKNGQTINFDYLNFLFKKSKLSLEYFTYNLIGRKTDYDGHGPFLSKSFGQINVTNEILESDYYKYIGTGEGTRMDENFNLYLNDYLYKTEKNDSKIVKTLKQFKRKTTQLILKNNFFFNRENQQKFILNAVKGAKKHEVNHEMIYIPILIDVGSNYAYSRSYYRKGPLDDNGIIHLGSYDFLADRDYWDDKDHLNQRGSELFTERIIPYLEDNNR